MTPSPPPPPPSPLPPPRSSEGYRLATAGTDRLEQTPEGALGFANQTYLKTQLPPPDAATKPPTLDQFEGCMVGIACGDMVGLGVENYPLETCTIYAAKLRGEHPPP